MRFARIQTALFLVLAMVVLVGLVSRNQAIEAAGDPDVSSVRSGNWSDPALWSSGAVPSAGMSVAISSGHTVVYDVFSNSVLSEVSVQGILRFSRSKSTRLKTNDNIMVMPGGFLDMGTSSDFIPRNVKSEVIWQLSQSQANAYKGGASFEATDKGLWAMSGSRWEVNGAPLLRPWSKLDADAPAGATSVVVANDVADWHIGGSAVITQTSNPAFSTVDSLGRSTTRFKFENEVRTVTKVEPLSGARTRVSFDQPLAYSHQGTAPYQGEVGLLSRNVRFETELQGVSESNLISDVGTRKFAHTMWMNGAKGDAQYAEFKFMGNYLKEARYPIHTHQMRETSVGKLIRGNGIWYTGFRWVDIHTSYGVTVEDNVGFSATQSGYFGEADFYHDPRFPNSNRFVLEGANKDLVFVHNLGVEATAVRFEDRSDGDFVRHSTFWVASSDGYAFLGNTAVGTREGSDTGGFLVGEVPFNSPGTMGEHFLKNESHSNKGNGFFHWNNRSDAFEMVDSLMWRNGNHGMHLGAYTGEFMTFNSRLHGNRHSGVLSNSTDTFVQDSLITDSPMGWRIGDYFAEQNPDEPHWNVRNTYRDLDVGYSHRHDECTSSASEKQERTRKCSADYSYVIGNVFDKVKTPIDFGWQANANSWHRVADSVGLDSGLPRNFYINRRDQKSAGNQGPQSAAIVGDGSNSTEYAGFGALVTPIATPWADQPPEVRLEVTMSGKTATLKATATDDKDTPQVEFFIDWEKVATRSAPPYEVTVDLVDHPRKYAYIYARAFDSTAVFRHELGVSSSGRELRGPYQQRAYSEVTEIGPEFLVTSSGNSGNDTGPNDLTPPVVTITTPAQGASYFPGQPVLAAFTCADEAGGSGVAACLGDLSAGAAIDTANLGAHSFTVTGTDNAGNQTRVVHNYTVADESSSSSALLEDSFDRPDSALVGPGWVEVEQPGASVSIATNRLFFDDTSDGSRHPVVRRTFSPVASGTLQWNYNFDWTRTGNEETYAVLMQLGDSGQMSDSVPDVGVGVNLVWSNTGGVEQNLGYRRAGVDTPLGVLSGPAAISVSADLDLHTYSVAINGAVVQSGLPFDAMVSLDTVRFLTDGLNEANFAGRAFDNVAVSSSDAALPSPTPPSPSQVQDQSVSAAEDTLLMVSLTASDPNQCDLSFSIVTPPTQGFLGGLISQPCTAGAPHSDSATVGYTPNPGAAGIDSFQWRVNNGQADSQVATVSVSIGSSSESPPVDTSTALLEDFFDRPDSTVVGPDWVEVEQAGTSVSIAANRLFFDDTSDAANHPLVRRTFSPVASGTLQWNFDFDWARTGAEETYAVLMQLGDSSQMSDSISDVGGGVNLVWTNIGGGDQNLGYRQAGVDTPLGALSGPAAISVSVDLDLHTYSVAINGAVVQSGLPLDASVSLDTVRFLTDGLNEANFSGRAFDNVVVLGPS